MQGLPERAERVVALVHADREAGIDNDQQRRLIIRKPIIEVSLGQANG